MICIRLWAPLVHHSRSTMDTGHGYLANSRSTRGDRRVFLFSKCRKVVPVYGRYEFPPLLLKLRLEPLLAGRPNLRRIERQK